MRSFARFMVFGGLLLFLLAAFCQVGYLTEAAQVADVLAMGTSLLASAVGLLFLLATRGVTREDRHTTGEAR